MATSVEEVIIETLMSSVLDKKERASESVANQVRKRLNEHPREGEANANQTRGHTRRIQSIYNIDKRVSEKRWRGDVRDLS